jgi:hypothetical protein
VGEDLAREWYEEVFPVLYVLGSSSLGRYGDGFANNSGY